VDRVEPTETNIVIFYLKPEVEQDRFLSYLEMNYVRISAMGQGKWRMVTHLDYSDAQHQKMIQILSDFDRVED
jgi:threonine aldolase